MKTYQKEVNTWMRECFGDHITDDIEERCKRFLEEALELVQCMGISRDHAAAMVTYVYAREPGEIEQELGGTMVCLAALCNTADLNIEVAAHQELERCWNNTVRIRNKHINKPDVIKGKP